MRLALALPSAVAASLCACATPMLTMPPEAMTPAPAAQPVSGFPKVRLSVVDRTRGLNRAGPALWTDYKVEKPLEATVREAVEAELRADRVPVASDAACTLEVAISSAAVQWPPGFGVLVETMVQLHAAALDDGNNVLWEKGEFIGGSRGTAGAGCCGAGEANRGLPQAARVAAAKLGAALNDPALLEALEGAPAGERPRMARARPADARPSRVESAPESAVAAAAPAAPAPAPVDVAGGPQETTLAKHARIRLTDAEAAAELLP